jgi:hypothetical protein
MACTITKVGEINLLKILSDSIGGNSWYIRLYSTDFDLEEDGPDLTSAEVYDAESNFNGYGSSSFSFNTPVIDEDTGHAVMTATSNIQFAHAGGGSTDDVYGYAIFCTNDNTGLVGLERFADAPREMMVLGDVFTVTPCLRIQQLSVE